MTTDRKRQLAAARCRRYRLRHPGLAAERQRKRRAADPEKARRWGREQYAKNPWAARRRSWKRHGIDPLLAEQRLRAHSGQCELCGTTKPNGTGGWHVDHDHTRGIIRGILCWSCNSMLGRVERLGVASIVNYLAKE